MKKHHEVDLVDFVKNDLVLRVDGHVYHFPLDVVSSRLLAASEMERTVYEVSPSGYGISWLLVDEDLSIDGLLRLAEVNGYGFVKT